MTGILTLIFLLLAAFSSTLGLVSLLPIRPASRSHLRHIAWEVFAIGGMAETGATLIGHHWITSLLGAWAVGFCLLRSTEHHSRWRQHRPTAPHPENR